MIDLDRLLVPLTREGGAYRTQYEGIMTTDHARAILSLAVRMAYASGEATHEEIAFLESLSEWLAVRTERGAIALALDTAIENRDEEDFLRQHVAALASQPMRELAFKAAHVTRLCDFETDPMEEACEAELIEALDLAAVADDLRDEVNTALMGGEPEAI